MELKFKQLNPRAVLPSQANPGDAGFDLHSTEQIELLPGERAAVSTGLAVEIPAGHAGLVLPRSGTAARNGIALVNSPGLIDSGYRGELKVLLLNTDRLETFTASPGDRIAQLVIVSIPELTATWEEELSTAARGEGGFGSSGR